MLVSPVTCRTFGEIELLQEKFVATKFMRFTERLTFTFPRFMSFSFRTRLTLFWGNKLIALLHGLSTSSLTSIRLQELQLHSAFGIRQILATFLRCPPLIYRSSRRMIKMFQCQNRKFLSVDRNSAFCCTSPQKEVENFKHETLYEKHSQKQAINTHQAAHNKKMHRLMLLQREHILRRLVSFPPDRTRK